ncbi:hypothetical protein [Hydrogenovibrio marinus]|uniref:Uncharacterized protein n=1 Tax=Hydrogenovibrio marinus TaxID=28885 RepID=A0A066ZLN3_HYDMR|nr:hypothetical protein [Hydrogenovibrio marinus]KDN94698.1 hypothetical protein EI16_12440 [Hydrogenovibrio marinus]
MEPNDIFALTIFAAMSAPFAMLMFLDGKSFKFFTGLCGWFIFTALIINTWPESNLPSKGIDILLLAYVTFVGLDWMTRNLEHEAFPEKEMIESYEKALKSLPSDDARTSLATRTLVASSGYILKADNATRSSISAATKNGDIYHIEVALQKGVK